MSLNSGMETGDYADYADFEGVTQDLEMRTTEYTEYTDFEWVLRKPSLTLGMNGAPSRASVISVHSVHSVVSVFLLSTRTRACFGVWNVE